MEVRANLHPRLRHVLGRIGADRPLKASVSFGAAPERAKAVALPQARTDIRRIEVGGPGAATCSSVELAELEQGHATVVPGAGGRIILGERLVIGLDGEGELPELALAVADQEQGAWSFPGRVSGDDLSELID